MDFDSAFLYLEIYPKEICMQEFYVCNNYVPDFLCVALFVNENWTQSKCEILEELMTSSPYDRTLHNL